MEYFCVFCNQLITVLLDVVFPAFADVINPDGKSTLHTRALKVTLALFILWSDRQFSF